MMLESHFSSGLIDSYAPLYAYESLKQGQAGRWQSNYHDTMIDHDKNRKC